MRLVEEEDVDLTEYEDFAYVYTHLGRFLDDIYQAQPIHSVLGCLTPAGSRPPGS